MTMTRRTALTSLAAMAMAPIINLRPAIDRERLLSAFAATDGTGSARFDLDAPFGVGSLTYATDARAMCRAEISNRVENGERRLPNVLECWDATWLPERRFEPFALPRVDQLTLGANGDYGTCPLCSGRRKFLGSEYPDGEWFDSEDAYVKDYDIDDNTTLDPSCELCHGKLYNGPWQVMIRGVLMDYSRLKPIAALPCVQLSSRLGVRVAGGMTGDALLFIADGFEGIAMGMTR